MGDDRREEVAIVTRTLGPIGVGIPSNVGGFNLSDTVKTKVRGIDDGLGSKVLTEGPRRHGRVQKKLPDTLTDEVVAVVSPRLTYSAPCPLSFI